LPNQSGDRADCTKQGSDQPKHKTYHLIAGAVLLALLVSLIFYFAVRPSATSLPDRGHHRPPQQ
jgi:hypothetical protein